MSHDETFMSRRETSTAGGNSLEIRRENRECPRKIGNGRKSPVPRSGEAAIRAGSRDRTRKIAQGPAWAASPFFVPVPAGAGVPGLRARVSAGHGGDRPAAGRDGNSAAVFRGSRRVTAPTQLGMSQMGRICLSNEPTSDATNPRSAPPPAMARSCVQNLLQIRSWLRWRALWAMRSVVHRAMSFTPPLRRRGGGDHCTGPIALQIHPRIQ